MAIFPLLADPDNYRACDTDLLVDVQARRYWLDLFDSHFIVQLRAAGDVGVGEAERDEAAADFHDEIERLREKPDRFGRLDILLLDELRQRVHSECGIRDEFRLLKRRENEAALRSLPEWLSRIDDAHAHERLPMIARGMLAGNLFDMGVKETAGRYARGAVPFEETLSRVPARPWLIDDVNAANAWWSQPLRRISGSPAPKAVVFADNAGGDVVLGVLPLVRDMLKRGWEVILTANSEPSLNDVTHRELQGLVEHAAMIDATWESARLRLVESGSAAPLIDLSNVSRELAAAATGAELLVLVGMGRGVESNFNARFTCRAWSIAMIKDPQVAKSVGGRMYDAIFRQTVDARVNSVPPNRP